MNNELSNKIKNISLILTILVVFLHAYNLEESNSVININGFIQNFISYGVCTIAVPLFFMISGYLFFYKINPTLQGWINKYKKRFKSLVIPFVIWCIGWILVLYLVQLTSFGQTFFSNMIVRNFTAKQLWDYTFKYPIPFQLWYISDLIKLVIISPIIYYVVRLIGKLYGLIAVILWITGIINFPVTFFSLGCYLALYYPKLDFKIKSNKVVFIFISFLMCVIARALTMNNTNNISEVLLSIVRILGILSLWFGYDILIKDENKIFRFAEYGIFIYFFHEPLQSFLYRIVFKIVNRSNLTELILYFVMPTLTIFTCIIVAIILKKYLQKIYCVITGGR